MTLTKYERKLEKHFEVTKYIAEFWNTVSNAPFVIIGFLRLIEGTHLQLEYDLMIVAGLASAIHHATTPKWTIVIDWIPIVCSLLHIWQAGYLVYLSTTAIFEISLALFVLITDHIYTIVPVPWGHVFWHVLAAYSIDCGYQSVQTNLHPLK